MDFEFISINGSTGPHSVFTNEIIAAFLYQHLDEFGDEERFILMAIEYVYEKGGSITLAVNDGQIMGAVVINATGMGGYIPENILVYIATHADSRGQGLGSKLMDEVIRNTPGAIALHVEPDNPAKRLYERKGFTNKYLEMRLTK